MHHFVQMIKKEEKSNLTSVANFQGLSRVLLQTAKV